VSVAKTPGPHAGRPRRLPTYVVVGPERHGVVRHALMMADALHRTGVDVPVVRLPDAAALTAWAAGRGDARGPVHLDVTDALFGPTASEAASVLTGSLPARTTFTLHDVPQPAEGAGRYARRAAAYSKLARFAAGIVVSSKHEQALLDAIGTIGAGDGQERAGPMAVIPLPVEDRRSAFAPDSPGAPLEEPLDGLGDDVVLLGFLYPGKGHAEALDALAWLHRRGIPAPKRVTALGAVSAGHDDLVTGLRDRARAAGLRFRVTGFVPDEQLGAALRSACIPVAAHHNVSASGSLATWMSVGRRAVVQASRYTLEMSQLRPGTLHLVDHGAEGRSLVEALAAGIADVAADPQKTWLAAETTLAPGPEDCARALAAFWQRVHA
jgi:glycosyltransferase involved in cell wall biosynthesis